MMAQVPRLAVAVTVLAKAGAAARAGPARAGRCVLLVRRAKEPLRGEWSLPGGSVRLGEAMADAASRELAEETGLRVSAAELGRPFTATDAIHLPGHHYGIAHLAALLEEAAPPRAGDDASDARWFHVDSLEGEGVRPEVRDVVALALDARR